MQSVVTGTVLGPGGRPLPGAQAALRPVLPVFDQAGEQAGDAESPAAVSAATDAAGRFTLKAPSSGLWRLTVQATGMVPVQSLPLPLANPVELPPVALAASVGARLRLLDAAGRPLADVPVKVAEEVRETTLFHSGPRGGRTDAQGALELPRREGEALELGLLIPGGGEVLRRGFTGGTVELDAAAGWGGVRLLDRSGAPMAGAKARLGEASWPFGSTDAQGRLRLPLPASGAVRLSWATADGRQLLVPWPASGMPAGPSITLPDAVPVAGRIFDAAGRQPVPGALVWATADPGAFVRADAQGRFRLTATGRRRFEVEAVAPGYLLRKITVSGPQLASGREVSFALTRAAALQGKVVDPAGRPLPGIAVVAILASALGERAFDPADPVVDRGVSDAQGRFELRRLRPDEGYAVRAIRPGSFPAEQRVAVSDPAGQPRAVTLVLAPARAARGRVQDPAGKPVAGAEVILRPALRPSTLDNPSPEIAAGPGAAATTTDARGAFEIPECPAPEVELAVRKPGYAPAFLPALRLSGPANAPADLGVVTLRPGTALAGKVVDARRQGLSGAEVYVLDRPVVERELDRKLKGRKPAAASGADGRFTVADLPQGAPVHLVVRASGYLPAIVRAVRPPTASPVLVRLEPEAALRGRVEDEAGEPVPGARVEMRWQDTLPEDPGRRVGAPILRGARADAAGRFELRGFPARAMVDLSATAAGFVGVEGFEVSLPRPAGAEDLRLVLKRGAVLQGRVTTAAGEPVPAVRVGVGNSITATGDDGLYWLEGVDLGRRDAVFAHPGHGRLVKPFDVQPGVNVLDAVFDPGYEVAGRVADESGKPVAGARVELTAQDRSRMKTYADVTGEDGRFRLAAVHDGRYNLQAEAAGFAETSAPAPVEVAGAPVANLEVTLQRGAVLSGQILGLEPEDLQKVEVTAYGDLGATLPGWTDGRGRYEVRALPPGDWTVRAVLWDGQRKAQIRVAVGRAGREIERDIEFDRRLTLTAQVLYDEEPLPDAQVSLRGQRFAAERIVVTDYEGRFTVDDLEPDTYRLGLTHSAKMLVHNDQVELQADREVVIRLAASSLEGIVVSEASGDPVAGALLMLRPVEGPEFLVSLGSGEDGRFAAHRVPPVRFRLEARAQGFAPVEQEIQLTAGQALEGVEVRLPPAPGAKLQVRLPSGQVPPLVHVLVRPPGGGSTLLAESRPPDAEGLLDLSSLPPGAWEYLVRADGAALAAGTLTVPAEPSPPPVTLAPAGSLLVRVPALVPSELAATLRILGPGQQPFATLNLGGALERQWTLVGGKTLVDGLPAGVWTLAVEAPDGQRWTGTAVTAGGGQASAILE